METKQLVTLCRSINMNAGNAVSTGINGLLRSLCILYSMDYMNTRTGVFMYGRPSVLVLVLVVVQEWCDVQDED